MSPPDPRDPDPSPFPAVTLDDWRAEAERVLKGKPLSSLTWRTEDGIELSPVAADAGCARPAVRTRTGAVLSCTTVEDAEGVRAALDAGFDLVRICYDHAEQADLLDDIPLDRVLLDPIEAVGASAALHDLPDAAGVLLGWWGWTHLVEQASAAQQIGWIVSAAVDVLTETDEDDAGRLVLEVPVGVELLTEIAKLRAIRLLWAEVAEDRDLPQGLRILATCPSFPHTRLDAESNLLRATLAGFAAVTGGADAVELAPYRDGELAAHLTINQLHLMRDESALDAVADPLAGAGIVEQLTDALLDAGRRELERLRALGGFLAVERDWNEERLEQLVAPYEECQDVRADAIAHRRRVVVGINRFADPGRDRDAEATEDAEETYGGWTEEGTSLTELAADGVRELEYLRERMVWHEDAGHARPTVLLLPLGPVGWRRARADFAADLFRAGGFAIDDAGGLDSVDDAIERARGAAVVVLCSDDASYPEVAPRVAAALPDARVLVAGRPPDGSGGWGVAGFAYEGVNAVDLLCGLQDDLGVGRQP